MYSSQFVVFIEKLYLTLELAPGPMNFFLDLHSVQ